MVSFTIWQRDLTICDSSKFSGIPWSFWKKNIPVDCSEIRLAPPGADLNGSSSGPPDFSGDNFHQISPDVFQHL